MKQSFSWFIDMNTSATSLQVVKITAGGDIVKNRLNPFFNAYKYYKLGAVSVKFVPASTLPVDPTGLSLAAGENTVDPRDQFNPGLIRITNGEDSYEEIFNMSGADVDKNYYAMMMDRRWFKFQMQSGCRRTAFPMFWTVGQLHQDMYPGHVRNVPRVGSGTASTEQIITAYDTAVFDRISDNSNPRGFFQTGVKDRMGWMPTDYVQNYTRADGTTVRTYAGINQVPEVELMKIVLPKAYKTSFYYRVYITETVYFKEPVVMNYTGYMQLDRFVAVNHGTGITTPNGQITNGNQDAVLAPDNDGGGNLR